MIKDGISSGMKFMSHFLQYVIEYFFPMLVSQINEIFNLKKCFQGFDLEGGAVFRR